MDRPIIMIEKVAENRLRSIKLRYLQNMFRKTEIVSFITSCYYLTYNGTVLNPMLMFLGAENEKAGIKCDLVNGIDRPLRV